MATRIHDGDIFEFVNVKLHAKFTSSKIKLGLRSLWRQSLWECSILTNLLETTSWKNIGPICFDALLGWNARQTLSTKLREDIMNKWAGSGDYHMSRNAVYALPLYACQSCSPQSNLGQDGHPTFQRYERRTGSGIVKARQSRLGWIMIVKQIHRKLILETTLKFWI